MKSKDLDELSIFFAGMSVMSLFVALLITYAFLFIFLLTALISIWLEDIATKKFVNEFMKTKIY